MITITNLLLASLATIILAKTLRIPVSSQQYFEVWMNESRRSSDAGLNGTPSYGFSIDLSFGTPEQVVGFMFCRLLMLCLSLAPGLNDVLVSLDKLPS